MSTNRWLNKEAGLHIYKGILLSHKKEHIWASSGEVDEPRAYYREWSRPERERQISHIKAHIRKLERWYWQSSMQGSKGDTDVMNRLLDSVGEGDGGVIWENSTETYTLLYVKQTVFCYSMQQQRVISQSDCDRRRKVDCIRQVWWPAQWWDWKEAPKHFPKPNVPKRGSRSLVVCCLTDPLQLSESWWNHYNWAVS